MFKDYLMEYGHNLLFWIRDISSRKQAINLCTSSQCAEILELVIQNNRFSCISEEDSKLLFKDFIKPVTVTYRNSDLISKNSFYAEIYNQCVLLWIKLPKDLKQQV